jgi:hypothetical protein
VADKSIEINVLSGVEGPCLSVNNYRIVGPKPWGGGRITHTWYTTKETLIKDLREAGVLPPSERKAGNEKENG